MFRPSNHSGNHIREHEPVPNKSLMQGMIVSGLLVLAAYLLMVRTRWGQMVDIAAYSGRNVIAPALIDYDHFDIECGQRQHSPGRHCSHSRGRRIPPLFDRGCHHRIWICLRGGRRRAPEARASVVCTSA